MRESRRGTKFEGVISIANWYGTLTELAGGDIEDQQAEAANRWLQEKGLPLLFPVDSVPQWQNILHNRNGRADPLHLAAEALLMWPYKLLTGKSKFGGWTGPVYPNCSTVQAFEVNRGHWPCRCIQILLHICPSSPTKAKSCNPGLSIAVRVAFSM